MDDVNSYSIDVMMNLGSNAEPFFESIDNGLSAIESHVRATGAIMSSVITPVTTYITKQITDLSKSFIGVSNTTTKVNEDLGEIKEVSTDINLASTEYNDMLTDISVLHEDANTALTTQNILIEEINDAASGIGNIWQNIKDFVGEAAIEIGAVVAAVWLFNNATAILRNAWALLVDEEERFVTVNYRLYGTQREIVQQVNETTTSYGLLRGVAMEAYQELAGGLRIPIQELGSYINETAQFNRITGISISQIGIWMRRMRLSGYDLVEVRRGLQGYTATMRLAGATTGEMTGYMRSQTDLLAYRTALWGKKATEAVMAQENAMGALLRSHGADIDVITRLNSAIDTNYVTVGKMVDIGARNLAMIGMTRQQWNRLSEAQQLTYGKQIAMEKLAAAYDRGGTMEDKIANVTVLAQAWDLPADAATNAAAQIHNAYQEMEASGLQFATAQDRINYAMKLYQAELDRTANYQEAMNTLAAKFNQIAGYMQAVWVGIAITLAPLFMRIFSAIELAAHAGSLFINILMGIGKAAAILYSPFVLLYDVAVELMIGIIDGIQAALGPFLSIIDKIYNAIFNQGPVWQEWAKVIRNVGYVIGIILTPALLVAGTAAAALTAYFFTGLIPTIITFTASVFTGAIPAVIGLGSALWTAAIAAGAFILPFLPIIAVASIVVGVLAAIGIYLYKTGAALAFVTNLWVAFKEGIAPLWEAFAQLKAAFQPIVVALKPVTDVLKQLFNVTGEQADSFNWIVPVMASIGKAMGWVLSAFVYPLTWGIKLLTASINIGVVIFQWFRGEVSETGGVLASLWNWVLALTYPFDAMWKVMRKVIEAFGAGGAGIIEEAGWAATALELLALPVKMVTGVITGMGNAISTVLSGLGGFLSGVASVISSIGAMIAAPINAVGSAASIIGDTFGFMLDKLSAFIINTPGVSQAFTAIADAINVFVAPLRAAADLVKSIPFIGSWFGGTEQEVPTPPPTVNPVEQVAQVGQDTYSALVDPVSSAVDTLWTMVPELTDVYAAMAEAVAAGVDLVSNRIEVPPVGGQFKAEPITNIKMLTKSDGGTAQLARDRQQQESIKMLEKIADKIDNIKSDNPELKDILAVLRLYLPNIGGKERIAPDLSNWMG